MGWCTEISNVIHFNRETYNSQYDVQDAIEEEESIIKNSREELLMYAMAHPTDLIIKDCEGRDFDVVGSVKNQVANSLEAYEDSLINRYKLQTLLDHWELRSGDFVKSDFYYKCTADSILFKKDKVYEVNKNEHYDKKDYPYVIRVRGSFIRLSQDELNNNFIESTYDEWYHTPINY